MSQGAAKSIGRCAVAVVMPPRGLSLRIAVAAAVLLAGAGSQLGGPAAAHAAPPEVYVNGAGAMLVRTCIAETEFCPNPTEGHVVRSQHVPAIVWGSLRLHAEELGPGGVVCSVQLVGRAWNEREDANASGPVRGYGSVEGLTASNCSAPEIVGKYEGQCACKLSIVLSAEGPLDLEGSEASVCSEAAFEQGRRALTECPQVSERESVPLYRSVTRGSSSLPWRSELVRGFTAAHETVVEQRVGMAGYGECGPGSAEGTPTCEVTEGQGRCGSGQSEGEPYPAGCLLAYLRIPQLPLAIKLQGALQLVERNGAGSGVDPSHIEAEEVFSGLLQSGLGNATVSGSVKVLGSEGQALITAR